jgi:hypothetical protein
MFGSSKKLLAVACFAVILIGLVNLAWWVFYDRTQQYHCGRQDFVRIELERFILRRVGAARAQRREFTDISAFVKS